MAELSKYKSSNTQYEGMPQLTTAATQQEISTNQRLNKFLGEATEFFQTQAVDYATDKAIEDAIRNPITAEQLAEARQTGDNPVTKYLQGGTAYNDAITKTVGQQVAGELSIELLKYNSDILEQVRLGKFENSEEVLAKLKEPIQAQVEFFANIDSEMAKAYGSKATLAARNVYETSNKIFAQQKEKQAQINAYTAIDQEVNNYSKYLANNPDASNEQKTIYKETIEKFVTDTSLSMSQNQLEFKEMLRGALENIDDLSMADDMAIVYTGSNVNEVINDLNKYDITKDKYSGETLGPDQYELAKYYHNMDLEKQTKFKALLRNSLSVANSGLAEIQKEVTHNIQKSKNIYLKSQQPIPDNIKDFINKNIDVDSIEYKEWKVIESFSDNIEIYNSTPYVDLISNLNLMNSRVMDVTISKTEEELLNRNLLTDYVKNLQTQLTNDSVGTMLKRAGEYTPLDLSNPDILKEQISKRRTLIGTYGPLYGMSESQFDQNIMTKSEVNAFVGAYRKGDGATRVSMLRMIDESFGDSNSSALLQLVNSGLPTTAELSSYFGDPNITERFLSFDDLDEQQRLKKVATQKGTSYNEVSRAVANKLEGFSNMVMMQNPFNKSTATAKMENINDALTYYAINEMQSGKSLSTSVKEATNLINNDFQIEDTYLVPKKYNGKPINADDVVTKAERIKDIELDKFNAVPFGSSLDISEKELESEFKFKLSENGRWVNTADGTGLIFVIVMNDGSFAPIENAKGENLTFKFDNTTMLIPTTDIDISVPKDETRLERIGRERRAKRKLENKEDIRY
tara:strand:- start:4487 stop:6886 length:2400 start_codon:yes stop_codon:yes gene_type:complete